jgi:hypothetical protein
MYTAGINKNPLLDESGYSMFDNVSKFDTNYPSEKSLEISSSFSVPRQRFLSVFIVVLQVLFIVIFGLYAQSPDLEEVDPNNRRYYVADYFMFTGVLIMMFIGFG